MSIVWTHQFLNLLLMEFERIVKSSTKLLFPDIISWPGTSLVNIHARPSITTLTALPSPTTSNRILYHLRWRWSPNYLIRRGFSGRILVLCWSFRVPVWGRYQGCPSRNSYQERRLPPCHAAYWLAIILVIRRWTTSSQYYPLMSPSY